MNSTAREYKRDRKNFLSYNIDRSRGKIELDPNFRSLDFSNEDSDE